MESEFFPSILDNLKTSDMKLLHFTRELLEKVVSEFPSSQYILEQFFSMAENIMDDPPSFEHLFCVFSVLGFISVHNNYL